LAYFSKRLPHVLTRVDLARLLTATYGAAAGVDDEEAHEQLTRALHDDELLEDIYQGVSDALRAAQGPKTAEDAVMDKLSQAVQKRRGFSKVFEMSPALSAVFVRLKLSAGEAPEALRATLATEKGAKLVTEGLRALGDQLVASLVK
jgi:hypothetical protein